MFNVIETYKYDQYPVNKKLKKILKKQNNEDRQPQDKTENKRNYLLRLCIAMKNTTISGDGVSNIDSTEICQLASLE